MASPQHNSEAERTQLNEARHSMKVTLYKACSVFLAQPKGLETPVEKVTEMEHQALAARRQYSVVSRSLDGGTRKFALLQAVLVTRMCMDLSAAPALGMEPRKPPHHLVPLAKLGQCDFQALNYTHQAQVTVRL